MRAYFLMVLLLTGCAGSIEAQRLPGGPPTAHECRVVANKLGSDPHSQAFRDALVYGPLAACGDIGGRALADALWRTRAVTDTALLAALGREATMMRSPHVFEAALEVAADRTASVPARASSLLVLLGQEDENTIVGRSWGENLIIPVGEFCQGASITDVQYLSQAPLPADHRTRVSNLLTRMAEDGTEPLLLRQLAHCISREIPQSG